MNQRPGSRPLAVPRLILLASGSPRRAALLRQMGFEFIVMKPEIDETFDPKADPAQTAMRLSGMKAEATLFRLDVTTPSADVAPPATEAALFAAEAEAVLFPVVVKNHSAEVEAAPLAAETAAALSSHAGDLVVAADTVVVLDGEMMGKPESRADAGRMLTRLSGRTHEVFTGFTLIEAGTAGRIDDFERTAVTFRRLEPWEIDDYVSTGIPMDKAGAYGIQDRSGLFVDRIDGCFYNVVGFPLTRFYEGLKKLLGPETVRGMVAAGRGRLSQPEDTGPA